MIPILVALSQIVGSVIALVKDEDKEAAGLRLLEHAIDIAPDIEVLRKALDASAVKRGNAVADAAEAAKFGGA